MLEDLGLSLFIIRPCASEILGFFRGCPLNGAAASSSDWKSVMLFGRDDMSSQCSFGERSVVSKDCREKWAERE